MTPQVLTLPIVKIQYLTQYFWICPRCNEINELSSNINCILKKACEKCKRFVNLSS